MSLRLVRSLPDVPEIAEGDLASFCGHCGQAPGAGADLSSRVCAHCELGLVLSTHVALAPRPDQAFLVVDATLSVCALSHEAERLLGCAETEAVNRHISDFLVPADANAPSAANLLALLVEAAAAPGEPRTAVVRPRAEFGVRHRVRIGSCGPPQAALIVLD